MKIKGEAAPKAFPLPVIKPGTSKFLSVNFSFEHFVTVDTSYYALTHDDGEHFFGDVLILKYSKDSPQVIIRFVDAARV